MKNLFKVASALVLGAALSTPSEALVGFAVKGGGNMSTVSADGDLFTYGMGYMGGLGINAGMGPVGLIVDVLYTQRAVAFKDTVPAVGGGKVTTTDLYIPVQVKLPLMPLFAFTAGGYYSLPMGKTKMYDDAGTELSSEDGESDYGIVGGVAFSFSKISLEARYNYGIKGNDDAKFRSIDVLVGFNF